MDKIKLPGKKTKIVCTIGPASESIDVLSEMIRNGMNIARINFAHGDLDQHRRTIANVRAAAEAVGQRVTLFGDLPGPKIRIGKLAQEPIYLKAGDPFSLQSDPIVGDHQRASVSFAPLLTAVKPGDNIFVNDGYIELRVEQVTDKAVQCVVRVGGELRSHKGVNFPGIDLGISAFTDEDQKLLAFAASQKLDAVSQSFVQYAADVQEVRDLATKLNYSPFIIAKIERSGTMAHIDEILAVADGLMVARGDLGVEIPIQEIPYVQKKLIEHANLAGKPVITATQMLESMTHNRRPTRAEVTDVANAILDGTDAVMLSGETAIGDFPGETVRVMASIAADTELHRQEDLGIRDVMRDQQRSGNIAREDLISFNIYMMTRMLEPGLIFVPSLSGNTARQITRYRVCPWIVAPSRNWATCQRLQFSYGIYPIYQAGDLIVPLEERLEYTEAWLKLNGAPEGSLVLLIEGAGTLKAEDTRRIDIIDLSDD